MALVVENAFQKHGIGSKLLEKVIDVATQLKCKLIELDSGFPREDAHRFYEKMGFMKRAFVFSKALS